MSQPTPEQIQQIAAKVEAEVMKMLGPGGKFELTPKAWPLGPPGKEKLVRGVSFKDLWVNLRSFYDECFHKYNDKLFLVYQGEEFTYAKVWSQVSALGHQLIERFHIRQGDRVAVSMRNYPEWCISFIAITSIGGVVVPLNSWWKGDELKYGLQDSGSKVIILDDQRLKRVSPFLNEIGVSAIAVRTEDNKGAVAWSDILSAGQNQSCPKSLRHPDDYACIMYTSGSTGHPKGVVISNRGICTQLLMPLFGEEVGNIMFKMGIAPKPKATVSVCPVPLFHVTASHHIFLRALALGGTMILMYKWDPAVALRLIEKWKPNSWTGVPTMVQDMMEHPDFAKTDTSSLVNIGGGGAPTPASQVKKTNSKFNGTASQGYGLTEVNGGICGIGGDDYVKRPTSTGKPFAITEVLVIDPDTLDVLPVGQAGELCIKGVLVMSHYWNKHEKTEATVIDLPGRGYGWFRTGDIARVDEEGYIYILDRVKDIIIRGGENISCAEVESGFFKNCEKQVLECSAFGLKDERLGEEVGVLVVLKPNVKTTAQQLISQIKSSGTIAGFKVPKPTNVFFSQQILPRTASGKIMKRVVRDTINKLIAEGRRPTTLSKL